MHEVQNEDEEDDEDEDVIWQVMLMVLEHIVFTDIITLVKQESCKNPSICIARNAGMLHNNASKKRLNIFV